MNIPEIVATLDGEISRLTEARKALAPVKRGRPIVGHRNVIKRKPLSEEARQRIAAAMRKRWKNRRKASK